MGLASITSPKHEFARAREPPFRFRQCEKCSNCQGDFSIERLDGIAPPDERTRVLSAESCHDRSAAHLARC